MSTPEIENEDNCLHCKLGPIVQEWVLKKASQSPDKKLTDQQVRQEAAYVIQVAAQLLASTIQEMNDTQVRVHVNRMALVLAKCTVEMVAAWREKNAPAPAPPSPPAPDTVQ